MRRLVLAGVLMAMAGAARGEQIVASKDAAGNVVLEAVTSEPIMTIAPDKNGKRAVVVFLEGKRYEGVVSEVKSGAKSK